jgi:hypothetical protein
MNELFNALQNSALAALIGKQNHLFGAAAQLLHIGGLILVLAPVLLISLRLLGVGLVRQSVPELVQATARWIWVGLAILALSGTLIFLPAAAHYYPNPVFWFKFTLLFAAILFHVTWYRKVTRQEAVRPVLARSTAVVALSVWFGVAYAGRFIGFY